MALLNGRIQLTASTRGQWTAGAAFLLWIQALQSLRSIGLGNNHLIPDSDQEAMDPMIHLSDDHLRKDDGPFCMNCAICDPVFLGQGCGRPDYEFICLSIKGCCCLHLHRIVA